MAAQGYDIDEVVLAARGQLHEAAEALEGTVAVRLKVHRKLPLSCQADYQPMEPHLSVNVCQGRLIQALCGMCIKSKSTLQFNYQGKIL